MLTISPESREKILVISATGKLTDKDYKEVLIPRFGLAHMNDFEKMGVIGGPKWVE